MKLKTKDTVMVIAGRDRGKKGEILKVLPKTSQVIVEGINIAKRHTKPSQSNPKGGIVELTKPISTSKVMIIDPATGRPARIGYTIGKNKQKERVFKVSKFQNKKVSSDKPKVKKNDNKTKNEKATK